MPANCSQQWCRLILLSTTLTRHLYILQQPFFAQNNQFISALSEFSSKMSHTVRYPSHHIYAYLHVVWLIAKYTRSCAR